MSSQKPSNPKDAVGIKKVPYSTVSAPVMAEVALGMLEGALKYGRHNYRVIGVRGSVYYDATRRHIDAWWEGQDFDPDSKVGLHHITKAITSLVVLRDAMLQNKFVDDRPPPTDEDWLNRLNKAAGELVDAFPNPVPAYINERRTAEPANISRDGSGPEAGHGRGAAQQAAIAQPTAVSVGARQEDYAPRYPKR